MNILASKKIIWIVVALAGVAVIAGGVMYFITKDSHEDAVIPEAAENALPSVSGTVLTNAELIKKMSVATSTAPIKSTLSVQQAKKIKAEISAAPNAKSAVSSNDRQKLLNAMSVIK